MWKITKREGKKRMRWEPPPKDWSKSTLMVLFYMTVRHRGVLSSGTAKGWWFIPVWRWEGTSLWLWLRLSHSGLRFPRLWSWISFRSWSRVIASALSTRSLVVIDALERLIWPYPRQDPFFRSSMGSRYDMFSGKSTPLRTSWFRFAMASLYRRW